MCLLPVGGAVAPLFMLLVQSRGLASDPAFYLYLIRISASVPYCPICFCIGLFLCLLLCFSASLFASLLLCCLRCLFLWRSGFSGAQTLGFLNCALCITFAPPCTTFSANTLCKHPSANKVLFGFLTTEL
jgi:hypothetical protein